MTPSADDLALLNLLVAGGPLAPRRRLLEASRGALAAARAGPATWRACGLVSAQCGALLKPDHAAIERAAAWLSGTRRHLVGWHRDDYPSLLRQAPNPPLALFVDGDAMLPWHPGVAVVGSRRPSPGGLENAAGFARALARAGFSVVSGLADGVDTAAHRAALDAAGPTIAVLGTGPDVPYPRRNAELLERIAAEGAVVSEYLPGSPPARDHFPARNRILAGLSLGTLVVEAAERSGALITARLAAEAGREVFAVPGSIHNPMARGCHRLLREGAALAESASDVLGALKPVADRLAGDLRQRLAAPTSGDGIGATGEPPRSARPPAAAPADAAYHSLWVALGSDPTDMDQLSRRTGLTPAILSSMLLLMELDGRVAAQHGRYYRLHPA